MATQMLAGANILDFSRVLAGPLCTMALGDLGANVLKIERPTGGDETRGWGPPFDTRGESAYFLSVNRNKLSVTADLDSASDREFLFELIAGADVVVDNFRRGSLERRAIQPDRLLEQHPDLVWCSITGFGEHSDRPGYDFIIQAERGWMAVTGESNGSPMKVGVALADVLAGKDATIAILAALIARHQPGAQRRLFISLADSAAAALINVAQNALVSGIDARRWGNAHPNLVPYQLFDTGDRPIVVAVGNDSQWRACTRALGLGELEGDSALASNAGRLGQRDRVVLAISKRLREHNAAHWVERLSAAGVPVGVVKSVLEALAEVSASPLTGVAPSIPGSVRLPPPRLGEHTAAVRARGWDAFRA